MSGLNSRQEYSPFLVSIAVSLAAFMELLDTTIANVALAHIAGALGAGAEESTWVLTSYLVSNGIALPLSGWLATIMGRKNFFIFCILGFTFTSFMCGISTTMPMLIVFRLLQGLTGGGMQPTQQAIIKDIFPPEKLGIAFAITGITMMAAPILGPSLGGYITDNFSWRWIYFMNIPIGVIAAISVNILVQESPINKKQSIGSIDYIGLALIALSLGSLQVVLDRGQQEDWLRSSFIIVLVGISCISFILATIWLLKQENPIVDLKLFKIPSFSIPCIMLFFLGFTMYSSTILLPMLVQNDFGYNSTLSGLMLMPGGFVLFCIMPVVGKLVNKIQAKYLISFGMFIDAIGMWATASITPQTDYRTFIIVRIFQVVGLAFLFVPTSALAFSKISRKDSNNASAIASLMRNLGGSIGISIITNILVHSQQIEQANLVHRLSVSDVIYQDTVYSYNKIIMQMGVPATQIMEKTMGNIYQELLKQSSILAYRDAYNVIGYILIILSVIALFMPKNIHVKNLDNK